MRYIKVKDCDHCPFCGYQNTPRQQLWCSQEMSLIPNKKVIPKWCTLPDHV